ncbi:MAG: DUF1707 domain-containing protein [Rhodococcus sp.]|nr:DUF1707 domain-containing protein [Rhodococcus sp. (in: high G+C Gram-positive bacteria)]
MTQPEGSDDLKLSNDERLYALEAIGEHFAVGRLDADEFYERSGDIANARTLSDIRASFRDLPGGVPLEMSNGQIHKVQSGTGVPAIPDTGSPAQQPVADESELASLRRRGDLVESIDWIILGTTLVTFLVLQFVVGWNFAWVVWPSLIVTLSVPRMILNYSDEDEEVYGELKESDAEAKKQRLRLAAERIRELEGRSDSGS